MFSMLKRAWRNLTGDIEMKHRPKAEFLLKHGPLLIGRLTYEDGLWRFCYSEDFRSRQDLRPIVQFPDKAQVYKSEELWPFFGMRIPSLKQPAVERIVAAEHIDTSDRVMLLKRFGRRTISNPYELAECGFNR
jgi:HipA-like protein